MRAIGTRHQIWVDGILFLDVNIPESPTDGTYFSLIRRGYGTFDDLKINAFDAMPASGTVTGTVTNAVTSTPIAGARVKIGPVSVVTDSNGVYSLSGVLSGDYTVVASCAGYLTSDEQSITVTDGSIVTANIVLTPATTVNSVAEAKGYEDDTVITVAGPVVTAVFDEFFYIEDTDRIAGIRVNCSASVSVGNSVTVFGVLGTTSDGERIITASPENVTVNSSEVLVTPLGLNGRAFAPAFGLSNVGLLVIIWGEVKSVDSDKMTIVIDDGSGIGITAVAPASTTLPEVGRFVDATGVIGIGTGGMPVLRMWSNTNINTHQ